MLPIALDLQHRIWSGGPTSLQHNQAEPLQTKLITARLLGKMHAMILADSVVVCQLSSKKDLTKCVDTNKRGHEIESQTVLSGRKPGLLVQTCLEIEAA